MLNRRYFKTMRFNKNLNSFKVIRMINNCAYEFKLFQIMNEYFSMFYSYLLHLNNDDSMSNQQNDEFSFVTINDNKNL